jgi:Fe-Mn family superoxide dismutase
MSFQFLKTFNLEESKKEKLEQLPLDFSKRDLQPVMSKATLDYHYDGLAAKYFERYNKGEGDTDFNYGGAILHNLFFSNLQPPSRGNSPAGASLEIIEKKYSTFDKFKEAVEKEFMAAQGSNWIYMDLEGALHIIHNHEYKKSMKIALLIDAWEHAWALDYQQDKTDYLKNIWRIINWSAVNERLKKEK